MKRKKRRAKKRSAEDVLEKARLRRFREAHRLVKKREERGLDYIA